MPEPLHEGLSIRARFLWLAAACTGPFAISVIAAAVRPGIFEAIGAGERIAIAFVVVAAAMFGADRLAKSSARTREASAETEARRALEARARLLETIADAIPGQIVYIDRDQRYRYINAYRSDTPDRVGDEILGRTVREVRGEKIYAIVAGNLERALRGEAVTLEALSPTAGPAHWFRTALIPARAPDGSITGVFSFSQDVTERKTAELLRDLSEQRLLTITDNLPAMICYVDADRCFRFANRAFEKWLQRPLGDIIGRPFGSLLPDDLAQQFDEHFARGIRGQALEHEIEVATQTAGPRWLRCAFIPDVDGASGAVRGVYGMIHNVTKAKRAEQHLSRLARYDSLTGLANRHHFEECFERALHRHPSRNAPFALMFLDIDHFKEVNDRYGHAGGDTLLTMFAQRLTECLRPTDTVARLSGDEFVVLLEEMHSDDEPQFIARKILATIDKPFMLEARFAQVTTSIGIAMRTDATESQSQLMRRADEALYVAKREGRNTFRMAG